MLTPTKRNIWTLQKLCFNYPFLRNIHLCLTWKQWWYSITIQLLSFKIHVTIFRKMPTANPTILSDTPGSCFIPIISCQSLDLKEWKILLTQILNIQWNFVGKTYLSSFTGKRCIFSTSSPLYPQIRHFDGMFISQNTCFVVYTELTGTPIIKYVHKMRLKSDKTIT